MMSSQQPDDNNFPARLRVLVVDDDPECLNGIENNLKNYNYEVTTCSLAQLAIHLLKLIKERSQNGFDLALCGVNKPQMNGFEFIHYVGMFEADLPIIMMSDYGDKDMVMRGCELGTTFNIYKPIEPRDLSCIWEHTYRKRLMKRAENEIEPPRSEGGGGLNNTMMSSGNKRNEPATADVIDPRPAKKKRFVWTDEYHQRFVAAFEKLGEKATPLRIMAEMNMPGLTKEIVSSHLQKYRIGLLRAQNEREQRDQTSMNECTNRDETVFGGVRASSGVALLAEEQRFHPRIGTR